MDVVTTIAWVLTLAMWFLERRQLRKSVRDWVGRYEEALGQRDAWKDLYRRESANYEVAAGVARTTLAMLEVRKSSENKKEGF